LVDRVHSMSEYIQTSGTVVKTKITYASAVADAAGMADVRFEAANIRHSRVQSCGILLAGASLLTLEVITTYAATMAAEGGTAGTFDFQTFNML
jgi:uncharacterized membrane protein